MDDNLLLKIALTCSIAGIFLLFLVSQQIKPEQLSAGQLERAKEDADVIASGRILKIIETNKTLLIEIEQSDKIKIVLFKDSDIGLLEGDYIEVRGKVTEYKGENEILADEVRVVR